MMKSKLVLVVMSGCVFACLTTASAQRIPDVRCQVEDYPVRSGRVWQFPRNVNAIQVVLLRDPAGEQEARFDLLHGATLVSLRYHGKELLYGQSTGASVNIATMPAKEDLQDPGAFRSTFGPTQGGTSMGVPATTAGVGCRGQQSMRAIAMMVDLRVDASFQKEPLMAVWKGGISDNMPPGYSTPFTIETDASWVSNPGKTPSYYLQLEQTVVNVRPQAFGPLLWSLSATSGGQFDHGVRYPEGCTEKNPCATANTPVLAIGRYEDEREESGVAMVVPTGAWATNVAYTKEGRGGEFLVPRYVIDSTLLRRLDGVAAFRFKWYLCSGKWQQVRQFADHAK